MPDLMDIERVRDINRLFTEINQHKALLKNLQNLKDQYADLVNNIYELCREDSQAGAELTARALEFGQAIEDALAAPARIAELEEELTMKHGILPKEIIDKAA